GDGRVDVEDIDDVVARLRAPSSPSEEICRARASDIAENAGGTAEFGCRTGASNASRTFEGRDVRVVTELAWKSGRSSVLTRHRNAPTHSRSRTSSNIDT